MSNALMNIQIIPKVHNLEDLYPTVEAAIALVESSGLVYEVGALGTTVEGQLGDLVDLVEAMNNAVIDRGAVSVISQVRFYQGQDDISMDDLTSKFR